MTKKKYTFEDVFNFYGVEFNSNSGSQVVGDCFDPDCEAENKLHLNPENGLWDCKVCGKKGNMLSFLRELHSILQEFTSNRRLEKLITKIPTWSMQALRAVGVVYDDITEAYFIPYYHPVTGQLVGLSKYVWIKGKYHIRRPPNVKGELEARPLCLTHRAKSIESKAVKTIYIPEGEKDSITLISKLMAENLDDPWAVVGVPGANTFKDSWTAWFKDKDTILGYDNDRAGNEGASKVIGKLEQTAKSISVVDWSKEFGSEDMDITDFFKLQYNYAAFEGLTIPYDQWEGMVQVQVRVDTPQIDETSDLLPISNYLELINSLEDRFVYKPRAIRAIAVTLGVYLSTPLPDKPVWLFLVAPASAGKTTVIDGMGTDNAFQYQVSKFGPKVLVSGGGGQGNDFSLMPRLQNRCLGIKDFTPILEMSAAVRDETFGLMRDAYDGHVTIAYGNGVTRTYPDTHWSCVAGVTEEIRKINNTSMGERFVRINFIDPYEDHLDQTMLAIADPPEESDEDVESKYDFARRRILGFVQQRASEIFTLNEEGYFKPTYIPRFEHKDVMKRIAFLAEVTARLRTEVPRSRGDDVAYRPSPELGSRLGTQFKKVSQGLCYLLNKQAINDDVYPHVAQVAVDTSLPHYYEIVHSVLRMGQASEAYIAEKCGLAPSITNRIIRDMNELGILEPKSVMANASGRGGRARTNWAVEEDFAAMFKEAFPKGVTIYD